MFSVLYLVGPVREELGPLRHDSFTTFSPFLRTLVVKILAMASSRYPSSKPLDLDLTIVAAKHLKNINWKNGDLKPYAIFWLDSNRRLATKPDDCGSTRPVWNESFTIPLNLPLRDSFLTLEVFHCKPSEIRKPLVGTLRLPLIDLDNPDDSSRIRTFELKRPSGRPQGKIQVKLAVRERPLPPDYHISPPQNYYYSTLHPPPPPPFTRDYREYNPSYISSHSVPPPPPETLPRSIVSSYSYGSYPEAYPGYYSGYYTSNPPPPPRPFFDRPVHYGGPSAPVDYSLYDPKPHRSGKMGLGTGLAVGAVAGALGGLALEEGLRYEEDRIEEKVENDFVARDDYSDYRADY